MDNDKTKQPQAPVYTRESSYAFEQFKKFSDRHLVEGEHDVRLFLDPETNYLAIVCVICEPRMIDLVETRH